MIVDGEKRHYTAIKSISRLLSKLNGNMNRIKTERKVKSPYALKINAHVRSGWCVHSTFTYGDVPDPLKMYRGKDCMEKFEEYIEEEVKWLYETFPRQPMTGLTDSLKREHRAAEKCQKNGYVAHLFIKEVGRRFNKK